MKINLCHNIPEKSPIPYSLTQAREANPSIPDFSLK